MLTYRQTDFSDGMDLFNEDYALGERSYGLAYNVRNRTSALSPVAGPLIDSDAPLGLKQGIYAFDNYLVLFNNGAAYYKNIVTDTDWTQISGFAMSTTATFIYAEAVPASTNNYNRQLQNADRIDGSSTESNVDITRELINTTDAGLVCQDGTTQGFLILPDATARQLQTFEEWTSHDREYVPKMTRMKYHNGILFGVAPDGKTIYRSVTKRPLDFVVSITNTGAKGEDASKTSHNVSYDPITCLSALNTGELFVGTLKGCYPVGLNYDKTIFAEPTFISPRVINAGVVNQFSFIDILGDYCFVDLDGIRSYNAVSALQNEGRNSIFSSRISKAFNGIKQSATATAAIVFDNYSIFAVLTIYGNVLAIFDNTRGIWVCFDNLGIAEPIKQFAVASQSTSPTLYAITASKVYKLYKSATELEVDVTFRAVTSGSAITNVKLPKVYCVFDGGTTEAEASSIQVVNNIVKETVTRDISKDENGEVDNLLFYHKQCKQGWKVQPRIKWQNEAKLAVIEAQGEELTNQVSLKQRAELSNT